MPRTRSSSSATLFALRTSLHVSVLTIPQAEAWKLASTRGLAAMATPCAGCGKPANTTTSAVEVNPYPLFIKAGSHLSHAEGFSGAKVSALISATECAIAMPEHAWQADPRSPAGYFCAVGAFDGMNALAVDGDGTFQTINDGKTYMRTFINTEITRAPSDGRTPSWYISTVEGKGGYGEPAPAEHEKLRMYGAIEQFFDVRAAAPRPYTHCTLLVPFRSPIAQMRSVSYHLGLTRTRTASLVHAV